MNPLEMLLVADADQIANEEALDLLLKLYRRRNDTADAINTMPQMTPKARYDVAPWRGMGLEPHLPEAQPSREWRLREKFRKGWRPDA